MRCGRSSWRRMPGAWWLAILLLSAASGCTRTPWTDVSCLAFEKIRPTPADVDKMSDVFVERVDRHNRKWESLCGKP